MAPTSVVSSLTDNENAEIFSAVLSTLAEDQLPLLASLVRQRIQTQTKEAQWPATVDSPLFGSYHVLFPLNFADGIRWLAKIPINGTPQKWDDLSSAALTSEARTMRLIQRETTIPLPEVLDFSATCSNVIRCPYIIMTFLPGLPLYDVWFGHHLRGATLVETEQRRTRVLQDVAAAMAQLHRFTFATSGALCIGDDGSCQGIGGPARMVDQQAMLDRWFIHHDPDDDPIYTAIPPSCDPQAYYTALLDLHPQQQLIPRGIVLLLRQLICWLPTTAPSQPPDSSSSSGDAMPFVLAHPDFDIQNFLVSEDGALQGILDWDGVAAVPYTLGPARYPGWLTRDWDPAMYGYTESMDAGKEPEGVWEDAPSCLARHRADYNGMMRRMLEKMELTTPLLSTHICRMSLITDNLAIAAQDPRCRSPILRKMLQEIWAVAGGEEDMEPELTALAEALAEGNADARLMATLQRGFVVLLEKEGL